jgi:squalene synthase HpnC
MDFARSPRFVSPTQSLIIRELEHFGPEKCERLSYEDAVAYTQRLVKQQYENFSVVSFLLPKRLRADFGSVYAFCRWADDLGDETGDPRKSLELLAWWKRELRACYEGHPRHPVFVALQPTIQKHDIPAKPFEDLIDAFEQDQRVNRYQNWDQVVDYCTRSADPVGRLVLYLCGYRDAERQRLSDRTCTALQLVNFWQDVRRDILERDRIYVPADVLAKHGLSHDRMVAHVKGTTPFTTDEHVRFRAVIRELVQKTWPLFEEGRKLWPLIARDVRMTIQLFSLGGESVMRAIEKLDYGTIDVRPSLGKMTKAKLMMKAAAGVVARIGARS